MENDFGENGPMDGHSPNSPGNSFGWYSFTMLPGFHFFDRLQSLG